MMENIHGLTFSPDEYFHYIENPEIIAQKIAARCMQQLLVKTLLK